MSTPGERSAAAFARAESWRAHPMLRSSLRLAFPGVGLGLGAFVAYVAAEKAYDMASGKKGDAHGHGHGAHGGH